MCFYPHLLSDLDPFHLFGVITYLKFYLGHILCYSLNIPKYLTIFSLKCCIDFSGGLAQAFISDLALLPASTVFLTAM